MRPHCLLSADYPKSRRATVAKIDETIDAWADQAITDKACASTPSRLPGSASCMKPSMHTPSKARCHAAPWLPRPLNEDA